MHLNHCMKAPLRLLMVEDAESDAMLLLRTLSSAGYKVDFERVETAAAMRAALERQDWDVITSDHSMPRFNAPEALAVATELRPNLPLIVVSGEISLELAVSLMQKGARDYVEKRDLSRVPLVIKRELHAVARRRERQQLRHALETSEARYRRLFEAAQDGILLLNANTAQIEDVNPYLINMLGYSHADLLGKKLWEVGPFKDIAQSKQMFAELQAEGYVRYENLPLRTKAGEPIAVEFVSNSYDCEGIKVIQCNIRNITERKLDADRTTALLDLSECDEDVDEKILLQKGLDVVQGLTESRVGFLHFVREDQNEIELVTWSSGTLAHYCQATFDRHYPVSAAGIWADSVRLKRPVVVNDYASAPDKKGLPEGHAALQRFISVPVLEGERVRMIVGVGNAARGYGPRDVETVRLIAYDLYHLAQRRRADKSLRESEKRFRGLIEQSLTGIYITQDGVFTYTNPRLEQMLGYGPGELVGTRAEDITLPEDHHILHTESERLRAGAESSAYEVRIRRKDGRVIELGVQGRLRELEEVPVTIGMAQDITEKKRAEDEIKGYAGQLKAAFLGTVEMATILGEMRDPYTAGHQRRVAEIAVAIGTELGMDATLIEGLRVAGYLHDIGKITTPAEILAKPGKLSPVERQLVRSHAQASYDVLKSVKFPWPVAEVVLQHHERMDGSGYPQGLKGEAILLKARILAVADVVEAMSSHRPYRPGLGTAAALAEIENGRGALYDPAVADACLKLFREKGYAIPA